MAALSLLTYVYDAKKVIDYERAYLADSCSPWREGTGQSVAADWLIRSAALIKWTIQSSTITMRVLKNWMAQNKLQLNSEKTEATLVGTRQKLFPSTPCSLTIPQSLSLTVKSRGVLLDSTRSM